MEYESIQVRSLRKNGLRLVAKRNKRSMLQQLDLILENASVPDLTERELEKELKSVKNSDRREEILVSRK